MVISRKKKLALQAWMTIAAGILVWLVSTWILILLSAPNSDMSLVGLADYVYGWLFWPILFFILLWKRRRQTIK
jgi:uncharacterized RDD family membrane protein YckC